MGVIVVLRNLFSKVLVFLVVSLVLVSCGSGGSKSISSNNVLVLTDIHFDPFTSCGESSLAVSRQCVARLINQQDASKWIFPKLPMNQFGAETNQAFLESALNNLAITVKDQNIKYIFLTGDLLSHHFPTQFSEYVPNGTQEQHTQLALNTMNYVMYKITQAVPGVKMYYIFGNNDTDTADYAFPTESFMQQVTPLIKNYMASPNDFVATFSNAGYSSMPLNNSVNVIGLNFNPLTVQNDGVALDEAKALEQFAWLESQLATAKQQNKKVIILQHEPFGVNEFDVASGYAPYFNLESNLQAMYVDLYDRYNDVITNYYYGHYHMEDYSVTSNIFGVGTLGFSVDFYNNPGFKVLNIAQNGALEDFTTYFAYYNQSINWNKLYSINEAYGLDSGQYVNFFSNDLAVGNNKDWGVYVLNYPGANISASESQIPTNSSANWVFYSCGIKNITPTDFLNCVNNYPQGI